MRMSHLGRSWWRLAHPFPHVGQNAVLTTTLLVAFIDDVRAALQLCLTIITGIAEGYFGLPQRMRCRLNVTCLKVVWRGGRLSSLSFLLMTTLFVLSNLVIKTVV